jgi:hypothetical protein
MVGQVNVASGSNSAVNYWQMTGAQITVGSVATPFNFKSYGNELLDCQRYYWRTIDTNGLGLIMVGGVESGTGAAVGCGLPVTMRATPSISLGAGIRFFSSATTTITTSIATQRSTASFASLALNIAGGTVGQAGYLFNMNVANSYIEFDSEL